MSLEMMKSILATIALALAVAQAIAGLRLRGHAKSLSLPIRYLRPWHRWGGDARLLLTVLVAFLCVTHFTFGTYSLRVPLHVILGTQAIAVMLAKVIIARRFRAYLRRTLILGTIAGLSLSGAFTASALWYMLLLW
ncbi:MAG: hypothetical protein GTO49_20910 [Anaerolineae bacterium]|nr:hypothetical protein [Anaerolineae bacterium]